MQFFAPTDKCCQTVLSMIAYLCITDFKILWGIIMNIEPVNCISSGPFGLKIKIDPELLK